MSITVVDQLVIGERRGVWTYPPGEPRRPRRRPAAGGRAGHVIG